MLRLGFAGIGLMGEPIVHRLLAHGFAVAVWNRDPTKLDGVVAAGARPVATASALADDTDVVMLCLADTAAVETVVFGADGLAKGLTQGQVVVDFSSIDPLATREFAARLHRGNGVHWIDAPVSGGTAGAAAGTLVMLVGAEAELLERVRPCFTPLAQRVSRLGGVGAGQTAKLCNQMIVACNAAVIAETAAMARRAGIDPAALTEALAGGFADSRPLQILLPQMAAHDFSLRWKVRTLAKDLAGAVDFGAQLGAALPMSVRGADLLAAHAAKGYADADLSTLIAAYESVALEGIQQRSDGRADDDAQA